jgi:hypothetical protein
MKVKFYILFTAITLWCSCDTDNSIDSSVKDYFVKFYGEDGSHEGIDFTTDQDGNFILLGNSNLQGNPLNQQIYLVKTDPQGMVIWQRTFGVSGNDYAKDVELTTDGTIAIAAETEKGLDDKDVYLLTVSPDGTALDSVRVGLKTLSNTEANDEVHSVSVLQSGFIISGSTTAVKTVSTNDTKDALHLRFTASLDLVGDAVWRRTNGEIDSEDVLIKMIEINSTTYYGFGYSNTVRVVGTNSFNDFKYWVFRLGPTGESTSNGPELLDALGSNLDDEKLTGVTVAFNDFGKPEFVLSGIKEKSNGVNQSFAVKLQENPFPVGIINVEAPTDMGVNVGGVVKMCSLAGGGFLLLSDNKSISDEPNISLIKLTDTFLKSWQSPVFFGGNDLDNAGNVLELPDQKILVIGTMTLGGGQKKMALLKINKDGKFED